MENQAVSSDQLSSATTESVGSKPLKLDLGCGKNKAQGFTGVDSIAFDGVDLVADLRQPWPWKDGEVEEVHCSHFVEHLEGTERVHFFNELYRVLKVGGQARIITPHWSHERAYGDPTHKFPPVCSWTYFYLDKGWREVNGPHTGYTCDFGYVLAGTHDPNDSWVAFRNQETKGVLMSRNINTTTDMIATLTKK